MTSLSHLIVTPCPNGIVNGWLQVSVLLTPRLRGGGSLASYPLWQNWGQRVANLGFEVWNGATRVPTGNVRRKAGAVTANPALWTAVFGGTVPVSPYRYIDYGDATVVSHRAKAQAAAVEALYAKLAVKAAQGPLTAADLDGFRSAAGLDAVLPDAETYLGQVGNGATPVESDTEFHDILNALRAYPDLMRRLGLIIDIEVNQTFLSGSLLQVRTNFPDVPVPPNPPSAVFTSRVQVPLQVRMATGGRPAGQLTGAASPGARWVTFTAADNAVAQSSGAQFHEVARRVGHAVGDATSPSQPVDVPAVDEGGIRVINEAIVAFMAGRVARRNALEDDIDDWLNLSSPFPPVVAAEDLIIGIRWDVLDQSKRTQGYRSLHQRRTAGYVLPAAPALATSIKVPDDEGWWSFALSTDGTPVDTNEVTPNFYFDGDQRVPRLRGRDSSLWRCAPDIMRWTGWSLSTPHPARSLDADGRVATDIDPAEPAPGDPAQVAVSPFTPVPKTLPRLRFGKAYTFRGRYVDLCGNSEPVTATQPTNATSPVVSYGRTTPVPPPEVVRRSSRPVPGVGDLTDVLVIKSELTDSDAATPPSDRMLFPPSITQSRLERHGYPKLDGIDVADYNLLAQRDAASLETQLAVDPVSGELVAGTLRGGVVTPGPARQRAAYLPDPATARVAFHGLPNRPTTQPPVLMATGRWPNNESVILELRAGTAAPAANRAQKTVTAYLPKGTVHEVEVSSAVESAFVKHMKWNLTLSAPDRRRIASSVTSGRNVVFSPRARLTLVHAVRLPLLRPRFDGGTATRSEVGQTSAVAEATVLFDRPTSDRIVLRADWSGPDLAADPSGLTLAPAKVRTVVRDTALAEAGDGSETFPGLTVDPGDTIRRKLTLRAEVFCRFSEYFTERVEQVVNPGATFVLDPRGVAAGTVSATNTATGEAVDVAENFRVTPRTGQVEVLATATVTAGTTLAFDYIPLPVSRLSTDSGVLPGGGGLIGRLLEVDIPASTAPAPPVVEHALPAYARTVDETANSITVNHDGRVVRVFLAIPWNSSGEGELLGVAAKADGSVSRWGRDATVAGTAPTAPPALTAFTRAVLSSANVDGVFDVAGHEVAYDAARGILTADIGIDAPGYRPIVDLALCRYQPVAVDGVHVSPTVRTEPVRLGAPRTVTVTSLGGGQVQVDVAGPDNDNRMRVRIEDLDPAFPDPDLGWRELAPVVTLTRSGTTAAATHTATFTLPASTGARRLVVEDGEPVQQDDAGTLQPGYAVAYREVIEVPAAW